MIRYLLILIMMAAIIGCQSKNELPNVDIKTDYNSLVMLFQEWRTFENPPRLNGAPDYTANTFKQRLPKFKNLQARLLTIDTTKWTVKQRVDWMLVWAEMNGFDFNNRVLQPWVRDPAFYKILWTDRSDVPAHEGPTNHGIIELWKYSFPLTQDDGAKLVAQLQTVKPFYEQAQKNLIGNARELWVAGIRDIRIQLQDLQDLRQKPGVAELPALIEAIQEASQITTQFADWLEKEATKKTGPSGIGKENYTWYQQNVHLVPMTWDDEVMLLKRELARAWTALKLEEHRNRKLPPLTAADSPEAYNALAERSVLSLMNFLKNDEIVTVKD
jgi:hypothetical protein